MTLSSDCEMNVELFHLILKRPRNLENSFKLQQMLYEILVKFCATICRLDIFLLLLFEHTIFLLHFTLQVMNNKYVNCNIFRHFLFIYNV